MRRVLVLLTLLAVPVFAQKPAPIELGFKPERVYNFSTTDTVNPFNGNLVIAIPLGLTYPVSSNLRYGLTLVYNSKVWDYKYVEVEEDPPVRYWSRPNLRSNAGVGWRISLGRLLPPSNWTTTSYREEEHAWVYEGPNGDEHALSIAPYNPGILDADAPVQFSDDGSYLRMVVVDSNVRRIEFPNGEIHTFVFEREAWRLRTINDPFGNSLTVTYGYWSSTDHRVTDWWINDVHSRSHRIHFQYFSEMADSIDRGMNVEYVRFDHPSGPRYDLQIQNVQVTNGTHHNLFSAGTTTLMPLLTNVSLPDTTNFTFDYEPNRDPSESQGLIKKMTLPTRGEIAYTHQLYTLPSRDPCTPFGPRNSTPGIRKRTVEAAEWTYTQRQAFLADVDAPLPWEPCATGELDSRNLPQTPRRWSRTSVLAPPDAQGARSRTDYYFHIYAPHNNFQDVRLHADTRPIEFAESGVAGSPGPNAGLIDPPETQDSEGADAEDASQRYLAQQLWGDCDVNGDCATLLRSTYRRNAYVTGASEGRPAASERTMAHDDDGCAGACYVQTDRSDHDRAGHFRNVVTTSNRLQPVTTDTRNTAYTTLTDLTANNAGLPWALERFTEQTRTIGGHTTKRSFCFAPNGALLRERAYAGSNPGPHDLITTYERSTTASGALPGDVTSLKSFGGDAQPVDTTFADLCSTPLEEPEYWNRYTYQNGQLATSSPVDPLTGDSLFFTSDYTIDQSGLVTTSRASDGRPTTLTYKAWGALESTTPPAEVTTFYTYTPATASALAQITMTTGDRITRYEYDRLGRLQRTERTIPGQSGPTCVERVITYDGRGRRSTEGTWRPCGGTSLVTSYQYHALGGLRRVTAPDGTSTSSAYTGDRIVTRTRSINDPPLPVLTREEYDIAGRLITLTENVDTNAEDGITGEITATYAYDAGDRLTGVTLEDQTRSFTYDGRGFLTSERQPELGTNGYGTTSYTYDSRGHIIAKTTGAFGLTMAYDRAERLRMVTETNTSLPLKEFRYDNEGQCTPPSCTGKLAASARYHYDTDLGNPVVVETYQYRPDSGRIGRKDSVIGLSPSHTFAFEQHYDDKGAIALVKYHCPDGRTDCRNVTHEYSNGLLSEIGLFFTAPVYTGTYATLTYHPNSTIDTVTHLGASSVHESWTADPHGMPRPHRISTLSSSGTTLWTSGAYSYDGSGNIIRVGDAAHTAYRYDPFQRLTSWMDVSADGGIAAVSRGFDTFGNNLFDSFRGCGPSVGGTQRCYTTSVLPATIQGTTNHYLHHTHDDAGNLTVAGGTSYAYDSLGMMTSHTSSDIRLRFLYTPNDERIAAVERITGSDGITRNKITYTLRGFGNQLLSVWTLGPDDAILRWKEDSIWRGASLLARESMALGTTHYSVDHLGSPRAITNWDGQLLGMPKFAPFGTGGTSNGGALQYTAHERDAANLANGAIPLPDYFHARYYEPGTGRFLSVDPVLDVKQATKNPQGWNRYSYVVNNPLRFTDPDGRQMKQQPCDIEKCPPPPVETVLRLRLTPQNLERTAQANTTSTTMRSGTPNGPTKGLVTVTAGVSANFVALGGGSASAYLMHANRIGTQHAAVGATGGVHAGLSPRGSVGVQATFSILRGGVTDQRGATGETNFSLGPAGVSLVFSRGGGFLGVSASYGPSVGGGFSTSESGTVVVTGQEALEEIGVDP